MQFQKGPYRKGSRNINNGSSLRCRSVLYQYGTGHLHRNLRIVYVYFLEGRNPTPTIKQGHEGGTVRLDVYYNKAENVAYVQLYDFCNYVYEPATGIIELHGDRAAKLISLV